MCLYELYVFRCGHLSASRTPVMSFCERQMKILTAAGFSDADIQAVLDARQQQHQRRQLRRQQQQQQQQPETSSPASAADASCSRSHKGGASKRRLPRCPDARSSVLATYRLSRPCYNCAAQAGSYTLQYIRPIQTFNLQLPIKVPNDPAEQPESSRMIRQKPVDSHACAARNYLASVSRQSYANAAQSRPAAQTVITKRDIADVLLEMRMQEADQVVGSAGTAMLTKVVTPAGWKRSSSDYSDSGYAESFRTGSRDKDCASVYTTMSTFLSDPGRARTDDEHEPADPDGGTDRSQNKVFGSTKWDRFNHWRNNLAASDLARWSQTWSVIVRPRQFKLPMLLSPTAPPDFGWLNDDGRWVLTASPGSRSGRRLGLAAATGNVAAPAQMHRRSFLASFSAQRVS